MLTRKLHRSFVEVEKLAASLKKNDWKTNRLDNHLELADNEIERVVQGAIIATIHNLQGYEEEAILWAKNEMTDAKGKLLKISESEQAKTESQLKHIQKTIAILKKMIDD